jgi:hypothetical protein
MSSREWNIHWPSRTRDPYSLAIPSLDSSAQELTRRFAAALLILSCLAGSTYAQRPSVAPTRLAEGESVRVDGKFDEPIWQRAALLSDLTQTEPIEGAPPTRETEVRLAYDEDQFYLAILCHEVADEIHAVQMDRDAFIRYDDVVDFWFDTFNDQRFAFWFQVAAGGSRGDALMSDSGSSFNKNWDGIWYSKTIRTEKGWQVEVALPFKTLTFKEGEKTWGFNLRRKRVENGEESRWANPRTVYRFFHLSVGGQLTGLEGIDQGAGLDITPYIKGSAHELPGDGDDDLLGDMGLDLSWRPTPSTTLRLTTNTDFAETEVDDREVNLTRFPLFFPEKRDFFLEDAGVFEFGVPSGFRSRPLLVPFFSRTIGRDDEGDAVTILGGARFTGRVGDWNIGLMDIQVDEFEGETEDVPSKNLGVLRLSRNLGGESAVGMILTNGRPDEAGNAATGGLDFRIGSSDAFGPGNSGSLWGYWLNSQGEGPGSDGNAWGFEGRAATKEWRHTAQLLSVSPDFDPALGYVQRTGIRRYRLESNYTWRAEGDGGWLRSYGWRIAPTIVTDNQGKKDSWFVPFRWFDFEFDSEDSVQFETHQIFERIPEPFDIGGGVDVTPDDYTMTRHFLSFETNERRMFGGEIGLQVGELYSGDIRRISYEPFLIPGKHAFFKLGFEDVEADLAEGRFHTQLTSLNLDAKFNPDLAWKNLLQYDTETKALGLQSRLHWILEPGRDLFLVALLGWERDFHGEPLVPTGQDVTIKLTYTVRL